MKSRKYHLRTIAMGVVLGLACSLAGSAIFSMLLVDNLDLTIGCFLVSGIPAALGGLCIVIFLNQCLEERKMSMGMCILVGSLTGSITGLIAGAVPTVLIAILLLMTGKVAVLRIVEISFMALLLATLMGWASSLLVLYSKGKIGLFDT